MSKVLERCFYVRATKSVNPEHIHLFTKLFDFILDTGFSNSL